MKKLTLVELSFVYGGGAVARKARSNDIHYFSVSKGGSYYIPSTWETWMVCVLPDSSSTATEGLVSCNGDIYTLENTGILTCDTKSGMYINGTVDGTFSGKIQDAGGMCCLGCW